MLILKLPFIIFYYAIYLFCNLKIILILLGLFSYSSYSAWAAWNRFFNENILELASYAIFILFLNSIWKSSETDTRVQQTLTSIVALSNWVGMQVQTDAMKTMEKKGVWGLMKDSLSYYFITGNSGMDDSLTSKPVRNGYQIDFKEDIREVISEELRKSQSDHT